MTLTPEQLAALRLIDEGEEYAAYFFKRAKGLHWFEPLRERGHFSPEKNPEPRESGEKGFYTVPHWPALDYLERVSVEAGRVPDRRYALALMEILRGVTRPPGAERVDNNRTWWYFTKILANLPSDVVRDEDIELVGDWLSGRFDSTLVGAEIGERLISRYISSPLATDWKRAARIVAIATEIRTARLRKNGDLGDDERRTAVAPYWLADLFRRNAHGLGERCGKETTEVIVQRLEQLSTNDKQYSYIWRPTIEADARETEDDSRGVLVSGLRDVMLAYAGTEEREVVASVLRRVLRHSDPIVQRVGIYVVGENYHVWEELFWEMLSAEMLQEENYRHELYALLNKRFVAFDEAKQRRLLTVIESLSPEGAEDGRRALAAASVRVRWLHAISGQGNVGVDRSYGRDVAMLGGPPEDPDRTAHVEAGFWTEPTPVPTAELLAWDIPSIVRYVAEFRPTGGFRSPSVDGLGDALQRAIEQQPQKFEPELTRFLGLSIPYQHAIVAGFREVWVSRRPINWQVVLEYCLSLVENHVFWQAPHDDLHHTRVRREWVSTEISRLIKAGTGNDDWAFEDSALPMSEQIILRLLANEMSTAKGEGDALTEAINTAKGAAIEALFVHALRQARTDERRKADRAPGWARLQPAFDRELAQCQGGNYEFSALAGAYLPNLNYLSARWVVENINRIFSTGNETNWRCAIEGYAYVTGVYDDLYDLLAVNGHLAKALETTFKNYQVREKTLQQVAVAYLRGKEAIENERGLFAKVLRVFDERDMSHVAWFFWTLRKHPLPAEMVAAILSFWQWCATRVSGREEEYGRLLSDLVLLCAFLDRIGPEHKILLLQAAPYADEKHHSSLLLEHLDALSNTSPAEVGEVYLGLLEKSVPTYDPDHIRSIVGKLYGAGLRGIADQIADRYALKGSELLRDVYESNRR